MMEKVRDKYWEEDRPGFNYDYFEWLVPPEDFDAVCRDHAVKHGFLEGLDPSDFLSNRKKQEELLKQIYESAAKVLSKQQYKVFVMRYLFGLKETNIATQMDVSQAYIARTIFILHRKIRTALQIDNPPIKPAKNTSKKRTKKLFRKPLKK